MERIAKFQDEIDLLWKTFNLKPGFNVEKFIEDNHGSISRDEGHVELRKLENSLSEIDYDFCINIGNFRNIDMVRRSQILMKFVIFYMKETLCDKDCFYFGCGLAAPESQVFPEVYKLNLGNPRDYDTINFSKMVARQIATTFLMPEIQFMSIFLTYYEDYCRFYESVSSSLSNDVILSFVEAVTSLLSGKEESLIEQLKTITSNLNIPLPNQESESYKRYCRRIIDSICMFLTDNLANTSEKELFEKELLNCLY